MYTIIATHQVQSYDTWKAGFEADHERRAALGVKSHTIGRIPGSPEGAVAIMQAEDISGFQQFMADPGLMDAMKAAGVLAPPTIQVLENSSTKAY